MENKINKKEQSLIDRKQFDSLLCVLAEGIIYVMLAEKVKNSRTNSGKEIRQE